MDSTLLVLLVVIAFLVLLLMGRAQIAKGANAHTANGAALLTVAAVVGVVAAGLLASLDVW